MTAMNEDLENRLRRALRPVEAPAGLADRIVAALPPRAALATVTPIATASAIRARGDGRRYAMPAALAASFVGAVLLGMFAADRREEVIAQRDEAAEGMAASQALMDALRVTSKKLDLAYQAVNPPPPPVPDEENRS